MSKRGVVAYSDSLRLEMAGEVARHDRLPRLHPHADPQRSAEKGIALEGAVPAEPLEAAAATLVRAALGPQPHRDLATSRQGAVGYALFRRMPRKALDRLTLKRLRKSARRGHFDKSEMAADMRARLTAPTD